MRAAAPAHEDTIHIPDQASRGPVRSLRRATYRAALCRAGCTGRGVSPRS